MIEYKQVYDVIGDKGFLEYLYEQRGSAIEFAELETLKLMDFEYKEQFSGEKLIQKFISRQLGDDDILSDEAMAKIASVIGMRFFNKWNKYWEGITAEYEILENYNMVEKEVTNGTHDTDENTNDNLTSQYSLSGTDGGSVTNIKSQVVDDTQTNNLTTVDNGSNNTTNNSTTEVDGSTNSTDNTTTTESASSNVFGYNNDLSGVPSTTNNTNGTEGNTQSSSNSEDTIFSETVANTNTNTNTQTGTISTVTNTNDTDTETRALTNSEQKNGTDNRAITSKVMTIDDIERTLNRHGNIGVTTNAQMQEQYLRIVDRWLDFCKMVYKDMDKIITLSIK